MKFNPLIAEVECSITIWRLPEERRPLSDILVVVRGGRFPQKRRSESRRIIEIKRRTLKAYPNDIWSVLCKFSVSRISIFEQIIYCVMVVEWRELGLG